MTIEKAEPVYWATTKIESNQLNRHRRNKKRRLNRRWHGKLRRKDEQFERRAYQVWVDQMAVHCRCSPPFNCPCDGVLSGGFCDDMHPVQDTDDDAEYPVEDFQLQP